MLGLRPIGLLGHGVHVVEEVDVEEASGLLSPIPLASATKHSSLPNAERLYSRFLSGSRVSNLPIITAGYIAPITASNSASPCTPPTGTILP